MTLTLEKKIVAGFAVSLLGLGLIAAAAIRNAARFSETFRWVDHTHQVLYQMEQALSNVLSIQNGSRGYVITLDRTQLELYDTGLREARRSVSRLRELAADNPGQLARLAEFESELDRLAALTARRHAVRQTHGIEEAYTAVKTGEGQQIVNHLRNLIDAMERDERALLAERSAAVQATARFTSMMILLGTGLAGAVIVTAGLLVRRDFIHRTRAEAERDRFFSLSLDLLCISSATDGRFRRVSPAVTDILGWTPEEFLSQPYLDQVHPDDRIATQHEVERQVISGEKVLQFENRYRHKDGSWRVLSWRSVPQPGGLMYAIARDVTHQKAAEAALRKSENEYRTLFESIDEGYCVIEMLFDDHGRPADYRFLSVNPAFEKQTGVAHALGRTMREISPDIESHWIETLGRIAVTGEPARFQNFAAPLQRWFDIYAFRYGPPAHRHVAILFRDITGPKRTEEEIRRLNSGLQLHTAQLEAANRELEAFSYSVSHDLRAPLRHIDGFAGLLTKHAGASLDDTGRRYLTTISGAARQMGRLIDDLLTFSRMGRAPLSPVPFDHNALVAGVISSGAFDRDPRLTWTITPLPGVVADASMLRQVWQNLIDNAVKYSAPVPHPCIEIAGRVDEVAGETVFLVRDNGVGFDMHYAGQLFGVFQRLHSAAEFEGTGIGLANVRRIVARHGGRTWAESTPGAGATFFFSLPHPAAPA